VRISVVALGFGMNLSQVLKVGRSGFLYTAVSITGSLALGIFLGKFLHVKSKASFLIAVGTAICGGSAIAATAPILDAGEEEISVAMGTVFLLNSVAVLIFPVLGAVCHRSQDQFGLWAALAIHDTSSVVGASAKYGNQALAVGTTVKLARALWIIPVSLAAATFLRNRAKNGTHAAKSPNFRVQLPWFILFFCVASFMRTYISSLKTEFGPGSPWQSRHDSNAIPNWDLSLKRCIAAGWLPPISSGHYSLARCCFSLLIGHPRSLDFFLAVNFFTP
jgi:uncharacterized integral membrane protein (TIGR00698 family)